MQQIFKVDCSFCSTSVKLGRVVEIWVLSNSGCGGTFPGGLFQAYNVVKNCQIITPPPAPQYGVQIIFHLYLAVAIATTRYCSRVERIREHIPVVIFVSPRVNSLMFVRSPVFPREELRCIIGLCRRHLRFFLGGDVSDI